MPDFPSYLAAALCGWIIAYIALAPVIGLIRANLKAYFSFRDDKERAEAGSQRVSEIRLLQLARDWGWIGAKIAQRRFRHKTRKEPFRSDLNRIGAALAVRTVVYIGVIGAIFVLPQAQIVTHDMGRWMAFALQAYAADPDTPTTQLPSQRPRSRPDTLGG